MDSFSRPKRLWPDDCCLKFLNYEKIKTDTLLDDKGSIVHAELSALTEYACEDADLTL